MAARRVEQRIADSGEAQAEAPWPAVAQRL
jgi:hypothetical protein